MADHSHTALIVVDSQSGAIDSDYWGTKRSNPSYEKNVATLIAAFRSFPKGPKAPFIIHIYHESIHPISPLHPTSKGMEFHACSLPEGDEAIFGKSTNSGFITDEVEKYLKQHKIWKVYFVGLSIDLCLGSTVRSASDLKVVDHVDEEGKIVSGDIVLVEDGVAAWAKRGGKFDAETIHGVHVESLKGEFARVVTTSEALIELGV